LGVYCRMGNEGWGMEWGIGSLRFLLSGLACYHSSAIIAFSLELY